MDLEPFFNTGVGEVVFDGFGEASSVEVALNSVPSPETFGDARVILR